jgi:hypothetical protein
MQIPSAKGHRISPAPVPVDFTAHICRRLDLYSSQVHEAGYGLFKTGNSKYFAVLMEAGKG